MPNKTYHKMVRDRIPEIIASDGKTCVCETLSDEDYLRLLDAKLTEELSEYQESRSLEELRRLEQNIQSAQHYFGIVERQAKTIAEAAEQDVTQTEAPAPLVAGHDCVTKGRKRNVSKKL